MYSHCLVKSWWWMKVLSIFQPTEFCRNVSSCNLSRKFTSEDKKIWFLKNISCSNSYHLISFYTKILWFTNISFSKLSSTKLIKNKQTNNKASNEAERLECIEVNVELFKYQNCQNCWKNTTYSISARVKEWRIIRWLKYCTSVFLHGIPSSLEYSRYYIMCILKCMYYTVTFSL